MNLGLFVALFGSLVLFIPQVADCYTLPKLAALALGVAIAWNRAPDIDWVGYGRTRFDVPILAFVIVAVVSTALSSDVWVSLFGMYRANFHGLLTILLCVLLFYAVAIGDAQNEAPALWALLATALIGIYGIVQHLGLEPFVPWGIPDGRVISTVGSPAFLGGVLAGLLPIAAAYWSKPIGIIALLTAGPTLLFTKTRGGMLGAAAGLAVVVFLSAPARLRRALVLVVAGAGILAALYSHRPFSERADSGRLETWKVAMRAAVDYPLLGWGPDTFVIPFRKYRSDKMVLATGSTTIVQDSAHNDVLQVLSTMGLLGLLAYAWLLWTTGVVISRARFTDDPLLIASIGCLAGLFVAAKTNSMPLPGLALAACALGVLARHDPGCLARGEVPEGVLRGARALSVVLACLTVAGLAADRFYYKALRTLKTDNYPVGIAAMRRAMTLNPGEIDYQLEATRSLYTFIDYAPKLDRPAIYNEIVSGACALLRTHPNDPSSFDACGTALMGSVLDGGAPRHLLRAAQINLEAASERDPLRILTLRRRLQLAWTMGDSLETLGVGVEYRRVTGLLNEKDQDVFKCSFCGRHWSAHRGIF